MRTLDKEIVRGVLGRMGDEAPEPLSFEELHTVLVEPVDRQRNPWWTRRPIWMATAAVAVVMMGVGAMLLTAPKAETIYVADGEILLATDPPIVQGAESPEPAFDTSDLGDEVTLTPVTDTSRILETAPNGLAHYPNGELVRITVLGETPEGVFGLVVHSEVDVPDLGRRMQFRCLTTPLGGTSCGGVEIENLPNIPGGLLPAEPGTGPSFSVGEVRSNAALTWEVPAETSVVTLTVNDQTRWQRPVADVALFITDLIYGDIFELTAFDTYGDVLDSFRTVASVDDPNG